MTAYGGAGYRNPASRRTCTRITTAGLRLNGTPVFVGRYTSRTELESLSPDGAAMSYVVEPLRATGNWRLWTARPDWTSRRHRRLAFGCLSQAEAAWLRVTEASVRVHHGWSAGRTFVVETSSSASSAAIRSCHTVRSANCRGGGSDPASDTSKPLNGSSRMIRTVYSGP